MLGEWSKSPQLKVAMAAVIGIVAISFFFHSKPGPVQEVKWELKIREAAGLVVGEEAAKLLGEKGGRVALFLPEPATKEFQGSYADAYERGFQQATAKFPSIQIAGHYIGERPGSHGNMEDFSMPYLRTLQAMRKQFPDVPLLISFNGLPRLNDEEEAQWLSASPPMIIALSGGKPENFPLPHLFQAGLVQKVFLLNAVPDSTKKPTDPHELFKLYYQVFSPSTPASPQ